jgi:hypothetical protein
VGQQIYDFITSYAVSNGDIYYSGDHSASGKGILRIPHGQSVPVKWENPALLFDFTPMGCVADWSGELHVLGEKFRGDNELILSRLDRSGTTTISRKSGPWSERLENLVVDRQKNVYAFFREQLVVFPFSEAAAARWPVPSFYNGSGCTVSPEGDIFLSNTKSSPPGIQRHSQDGALLSSFTLPAGIRAPLKLFAGEDGRLYALVHDSEETYYEVVVLSREGELLERFGRLPSDASFDLWASSDGTVLYYAGFTVTKRSPSGVEFFNQYLPTLGAKNIAPSGDIWFVNRSDHQVTCFSQHRVSITPTVAGGATVAEPYLRTTITIQDSSSTNSFTVPLEIDRRTGLK